jgi:hypothetical protein
VNGDRTRRAFLRRSLGFAAGLGLLSLLGIRSEPRIVSAHDVLGNRARVGELYAAMQANYYLGMSQGSLYNETSPRARSNPYAYLWPFYEAMAGTIDLFGIDVIDKAEVDDRLVGLAKYARGPQAGYDSYPRTPYGNGGDRYYDDNAWVARALIQLHRLNGQAFPSALSGAKDVYTFLDTTGWANDRGGGMYWVTDGEWNFDRGTGPTGGFAKVALHLADLEADGTKKAGYLNRGIQAYDWVNANLLTKQGEYAGKLYWDKILGNGSPDTRYWSYTQGVMIGAGALLARLVPAKAEQYRSQAIATADAAIAYYKNVSWYTQPVIFNSLFFRNLLLLCGELTAAHEKYASYVGAAQEFADAVWANTRIHNKQKHMIKFEERTSAFKLREQAGMVQIYACLAWTDAGKDLKLLS